MMTPSADSLLPPPASLAARLTQGLPAFGQVQWVWSTGSTNADLLAAGRGQPDRAPPWLLGSHHQLAGRGRAGRHWKDSPGQALMFSCAFDSACKPMALVSLGPAIGVTSAEALRAWVGQPGGERISMKWPNDLMLDDGKLAGILIESHVHAGGTRVVIGMGLNLSGAQSLSDELQRPVASLSTVCPTLPDITHLIIALACAWQQTVQCVADSGFARFVDRHAALDYLQARTVSLIDQERTLFTGVACGLADDGSLLVRTERGLQRVTVGDVSVRAQAVATAAGVIP